MPTPKRPAVDYLRFVLPWASNPGDDPNLMFKRARERIQAEIEGGTCANSFAPRYRYRYVFVILLPGGVKPIVRIGALDPVRQKGGISVEMNPAKLEQGDMEHFHEVMTRIVGRAYRNLIRNALLNRIDFAVDIVHARLDRLLVLYSGAQKFTVFGKTVNSKGVVETYNFGSANSQYMTSAYSKHIERRHDAIVAIAKHGFRCESMKANFIKQLEQLHNAPPVVRVEVRGVKLGGLALHDLDKLTNRFARFTFADLTAGGAQLPKKLEDVFISLCRDRGVKAALEHFRGTSDVRKVNKFWRSRRANWWKPEPMMDQALAWLIGCGVFPAEAFRLRCAEPVADVSRPRSDAASRSTGGVERTRTGPTFGQSCMSVRRSLNASERPRRTRVTS